MTFKTPDLCDEFEVELGKTVRVVAPMFQRYGCRNSFSGEIVTLKVFEDNSLVREAFAGDGSGKVLVIDGGGSLRCALLGDMLAELGTRNGWAGVVIHGCVRDTAELARLPLGVRALASNPLRSAKLGHGQRDVGAAERLGDLLKRHPANRVYLVFDPGDGLEEGLLLRRMGPGAQQS